MLLKHDVSATTCHLYQVNANERDYEGVKGVKHNYIKFEEQKNEIIK